MPVNPSNVTVANRSKISNVSEIEAPFISSKPDEIGLNYKCFFMLLELPVFPDAALIDSPCIGANLDK